MKANVKSENGAKNSNAVGMNVNNAAAQVASVNVESLDLDKLPAIDVEDASTTRGKVAQKFTILDFLREDEKLEKIDKNYLFSQVLPRVFFPQFDDTAQVKALRPLVVAGVLSEEAAAAAIDKLRKDWEADNAAALAAAETLSFSEIVEKLENRPELLKKIYQICGVSELLEENYIDKNGNVKIFRASQSDHPRYEEATLRKERSGKEFSRPLFIESRPANVSNILTAIRYYNAYQDAARKLDSEISKHFAILDSVRKIAAAAKAKGFSLENVIEAIEKAYK